MAQKKNRVVAQPKPNEDREIPEGEKDLVGKLLKRIDRALLLQKNFHEQTLPKLRRLTWGTASATQSASTTTRTNLTFATIATLLPHIYAKNPEIAVSPSEAVDEGEYEKWKKVCKTAEVFVNRLLIEEAGLKRRSKSNVRSAMTTSMGWLKLGYQENLVGDAIIIRRHNDLQDNLQRIEFLYGQIKDSPDAANLEAQREELKRQIKAITDSDEVKTFKGFVVDRLQTEDLLVLDESVIEFDDYVNASTLAHRIWMTTEEYHQKFRHKPMRGTTEFGAPSANGSTDETGQKVNLTGDVANTKYVAVWEVWDKASGTIYTVAQGSPGYCREPYVPKYSSDRWYTFFGLGFNLVEGRFRPISDVELIEKLQEEYTTTRYLYAEARKEAIPTRVFRKAGSLTPEDIAAMKDRRAREWIGIEGNPQIPLAQDFMQLDGIKIDPAAYDVTLIRNDIDMMVGLSDASRANLIEAKTATEAEIMRQALMTRVAERQDTNEDLISDMAQAALQIGLQCFKKDEVSQIVGADAEWPEGLTPEEVFHKIRVTVRAGSTGKPNQQKERESWSTLLPILSDTATKVAELRAQGAFDLAETQIDLVRETLRRFDERIDVDAIIPPLKRGADGQPEAVQNAIAQQQQLQEALQKCQEELQKCQQQLQFKEHELLQAKAQDQAKAAQIKADAAIEQARESSKAEQCRLDAQEKQSILDREYQLKKDTAIEQNQTERYKAVISMAAQIYLGMMKPVPVKSVASSAEGGSGAAEEKAEQPEPPSFEKVLTEISAIAEKMSEVADSFGAAGGSIGV